jgi:hypothetical protein
MIGCHAFNRRLACSQTSQVMQSGQLALIISDAATSVARRSLDGWRDVISRLDL